MPDLIDIALDMADMRFAVFPLPPDSKVPTIRWRDESTDDADDITARWPEDANIGIDCGKSGVIVVDVDVKHGPGLDEFKRLCRNYGDGDRPRTFAVATPSGGRHFYFESDGAEMRNSQGLLSPNIDIRAVGGFVVGWGSTIDGTPYEIEHDDELAPLPGWVSDLESRMRAHRASISADKSEATRWDLKMSTRSAIEAKIAGVAAYLSETPAPGRNNTLHWAACRLKEIADVGRLDLEDATETLIRACYENGLIDDDGEYSVRATIRSGFRAVS